MKGLGKFICIVLLLSMAVTARAGNAADRNFPRFTFGLEGNFAGTFLTYRNLNFISNYGYRIDRKTCRHSFHGNGEILVNIGCNISSHFNISLYSGYSGVCAGTHIHPLNLRVTWFPSKRACEDRWFAFLDGGPALRKSGKVSDMAATGKLGAGYRLDITRSVKLDFLISLRQVFLKDVYLQPGAADTEFMVKDRIRKNNASYTALTLGIGITF